jgi:hypothetical protein
VGRSNFCLKSNRENLFVPEEAPANPPLLSVSHAFETYSARLFLALTGYNRSHNPQFPKTSTVATSANVMLHSNIAKERFVDLATNARGGR